MAIKLNIEIKNPKQIEIDIQNKPNSCPKKIISKFLMLDTKNSKLKLKKPSSLLVSYTYCGLKVTTPYTRYEKLQKINKDRKLPIQKYLFLINCKELPLLFSNLYIRNGNKIK